MKTSTSSNGERFGAAAMSSVILAAATSHGYAFFKEDILEMVRTVRKGAILLDGFDRVWYEFVQTGEIDFRAGARHQPLVVLHRRYKGSDEFMAMMSSAVWEDVGLVPVDDRDPGELYVLTLGWNVEVARRRGERYREFDFRTSRAAA